MFGFGKKKKEQESRAQKVIAGIALEAIYETQKEILEEFDKYLVDQKGSTYPHFGTSGFYSGRMPVAEDIVAYIIGFIFGVCQSFGKDEAFVGTALFYFGEGYEKTTNNYLDAFSINRYEKSFFDVFEKAWISKSYLNDHTLGEHFLEGLAEGKGYADITNELTNDYSLLKSTETSEKLNLSGFRRIINSWKGQILFSKEMMALAKMPLDWSDEQIEKELRQQGFDTSDQ